MHLRAKVPGWNINQSVLSCQAAVTLPPSHPQDFGLVSQVATGEAPVAAAARRLAEWAGVSLVFPGLTVCIAPPLIMKANLNRGGWSQSRRAVIKMAPTAMVWVRASNFALWGYWSRHLKNYNPAAIPLHPDTNPPPLSGSWLQISPNLNPPRKGVFDWTWQRCN